MTQTFALYALAGTLAPERTLIKTGTWGYLNFLVSRTQMDRTKVTIEALTS